MRIEIRDDNSVSIEGYVNAVERDSKPLRDNSGKMFVEQVMAGVFDAALGRAEKVGMLLNHKADRVLGSTGDNLELYEDPIGLHARATVTDPEVVQIARDGGLKGWSFGFIHPKQTVEQLNDDLYRRRLTFLDLLEVSLITGEYTPAYNGTLAEVRAESDAEEAATLEQRMITIVHEKAPDLSYYKERIKALEG